MASKAARAERKHARNDDPEYGDTKSSNVTTDSAPVTPLHKNASSAGAKDADTFEQAHVHAVYDAIAVHFSATRYRPWPDIADFLMSLPPYSVIADVGCGNGKYFAPSQKQYLPTTGKGSTEEGNGNDDDNRGPSTSPAHRLVIGLDMCAGLLRLTQREIADPNFDPSQPRNPAAALPVARKGKWLDPMPPTDTLQCDARLCPLRSGSCDAAISVAVIHHYSTEERRLEAVRALLRLVRHSGGLVLITVWAMEQEHRGASRPFDAETGDGMVPWEIDTRFAPVRQVVHRYYHFFKAQELVQLCAKAAESLGATIRVKSSYLSKENWYVILERLS